MSGMIIQATGGMIAQAMNGVSVGGMRGTIEAVIDGMLLHRLAIAIGVPALGGLLAGASSVLTPRGKAKGLITGLYLLLTALGCACILFAVGGLIAGLPAARVLPLFVPGIALSVIMGIFSPEVIRSYQHFEFRKLAAELFRQS